MATESLGRQFSIPQRDKGRTMKKTLIASAVAMTTTAALITSASACAPGYKPVKIQGNWVCMLDVSPTNQLKANVKPGIDPSIAKQKLKIKR